MPERPALESTIDVEEEPSTLPAHMIPLPAEPADRWAMWRTVCVRGAGFPAENVLRIAAPECAAAADSLLAAEAEAETLRQAALEAVRGELEGVGKDRLDILIKAIQKLKKGKVPNPAGLAPATVAAIEAWKPVADRVPPLRAEYQAAYEAAEERLSTELREALGDERLREAIVWQNRHAAETAFPSLLRKAKGGGRGTARDRGHEQMLASYIQRYSVKNDTIGFFGPVGWGRLTESDETIAARPGKDVLARREVYFEGWAIDAIADLVARDEAMRPWLVPRRAPFLRREGRLYVGVGGQKVQFGRISSALLDACDGVRPARELVREVMENPRLGTSNEDALYAVFDDFRERGLITWRLQVPLSHHPERILREQLLRVGDVRLRERSLALLAEIVAGRDAVAAAAGNAEALNRALGELEEKFTRATGVAATQAAGMVYSGRVLVFEECRRDLEVDFGAPFLAALAPPLSLLLDSARWHTHYIATQSRALLDSIYAEMCRETGATTLDLLSFSRRALPALVNSKVQQALEDELHARWERVLVIPPGERRVVFRSEDLRPLIEQEFAAPGPGWTRARYHSPDLLVSADSIEAFQRGEYSVVLGEIHASVNTIDRGVFISQHPDPDGLRVDMDADLPEASIVPLMPKKWNLERAMSSLGFMTPGVTARLDVRMQSVRDFYLDLTLDPPASQPARTLGIGDLIVEPGADGHLVVGPRVGDVRFDLIDFYQLAMMVQTVGTFKVLPSSTYTPRISIDRLILSRETWVFTASELGFVYAATAPERFTATRRWAAGHGMPRFLFIKTTLERKPFYLDLESPIFIEIFAKAVRHAAEKPGAPATVGVSEMLPEPGEVWLPDAEGNRYTCELRMVAIDRT